MFQFVKYILVLSCIVPSVVSAKVVKHKESSGKDKQVHKAKELLPEKVSNVVTISVPPQPSKEELYETAVKDLKKYEGVFTIYRKNREVFIELPEDKLDKIWSMQATFYQGAGLSPESISPSQLSSIPVIQAGYPLDDQVFQWVKNEDQVFLVRPNLHYQWSEDAPLAIASSRSFGKAILGGLKIEQVHPQKKLLLINATTLFHGDIFKIGELITHSLGTGYTFDKERFSLESVKQYPKNTVVQALVHYTNSTAVKPVPPSSDPVLDAVLDPPLPLRDQLEDARSLPLIITYSLVYREPSEYRPRLADNRIGYFVTNFVDINNFNKEFNKRYYIYRYDIRSDKPYIWTLDPSIPPKYREAVRKGILMWNKAFDAIGLKNAIQVQDAPNDPDWDHADGRYNVIRWVVSPSTAVALAVPRADPFTGEILNAAVCVDANWIRTLENVYKNFITPTTVGKLVSPEQFMRPGVAYSWIQGDHHRIEGFDAALAKQVGESVYRARCCNFGKGLCESASMGWLTLLASLPEGQKPKVSQEEFVEQYITDVICHEVGHCLGLRHNFTAKKYLSTAQLANDGIIAKYGLTASVMDYTPYNIQAALNNGHYYATPMIGVYDMWAIKYGYMPIQAGTPDGEVPVLSKLASECNAPGLAFQTDEDVSSPNPYVLPYLMSADPINYTAKMIEAARKVREYAANHLPLHGESYGCMTRVILRGMLNTFRQGAMILKFMGGVDTNRNYRGDPGEKPTMKPIDAALQRQAMHLITQECLSPNAVVIPDKIFNNLSKEPEWYIANTWDAPLRILTSNPQNQLALVLMSHDITNRILENQFRTEHLKDYYTLAEHYDLLIGSVYEEIGKSNRIIGTRRDLQKKVLHMLLIQADLAVIGTIVINDDVRVVASHQLKVLKERIDKQLVPGSSLEVMTRLHLADMQDKLKRFFARQAITGSI